jgi:hypothetical protein
LSVVNNGPTNKTKVKHPFLVRAEFTGHPIPPAFPLIALPLVGDPPLVWMGEGFGRELSRTVWVGAIKSLRNKDLI